ncbi:peptidoglycan recognition protein 5 [Osmerus eperlanus]
MVTVVPRRQWGAVSPRCRNTLKGPAQRAVIHHTALSYCESPCECVAELTRIQTMHMQDRDFDDIGYNFLVGGDGTVYEGRGWGIVGAHAKENNHDSVGIALLGNFNIDSPSPAALSSVRQLLLHGISQGYLDTRYILLGHSDLRDTECPGKRLYASLHQCKPTDF